MRATSEGVYLQIKLQPKASKAEIGEASGPELKIRVTAPPVDSAANEALVRLLAEALDVARRDVALVKGQTSRHKLVFIRGATPESIETRLRR